MTVRLCERCHSKAHGRLMTTRALVVDALKRKKAKGERVGRVPFGYTLAADGVQLVPIAAEQAVLVTIRELRAAGETLRAIAAELDRRGVATKNGKPWSHSTIQAILERADATPPGASTAAAAYRPPT